MAVRVVNIGVLPTACWIEYAAGRELDPAVLADPDFSRAERIASRIVVFQNDIAGFDKDAQSGWPNVVRSVAADDGVSLAVAFDTVAELHDFDVGELAATCERLVRRHGEAARFWTQGILRLVAGLAAWHVSTPRYQATLPDGEVVRVMVEPNEAPSTRSSGPPSTPLGRAAATPSVV
jgi:hypothetical protein